MEAADEIVVVYVGGFLEPEEYIVPRLKHLTAASAHNNVRIIAVYPSSVSSLHDRAMQIFWELKGGTVRYGCEHSAFHGHDVTGPTFPGKYPAWDGDHPVHIIGNSFGGLTARVLHAYLADGVRFEGHATAASWVVSVNTMNAPLNGCLMVYSLGANLTLAPVVRWASPGCMLGWIAHLWELLAARVPSLRRDVYDFKLAHWRLSWAHTGSGWRSLLLALCGVSVHSNTDNAAYDMTIQSQLAWQQHLAPTLAGVYYTSTVGTSYMGAPEDQRSFLAALAYWAYILPRYFLRSTPRSVCGVDTTRWLEDGFDGLLSAHTQGYPCLHADLLASDQPCTHGGSGQQQLRADGAAAAATAAPASATTALLGMPTHAQVVTCELDQLGGNLADNKSSSSSGGGGKRGAISDGIWYVRHVKLGHLAMGSASAAANGTLQVTLAQTLVSNPNP